MTLFLTMTILSTACKYTVFNEVYIIEFFWWNNVLKFLQYDVTFFNKPFNCLVLVLIQTQGDPQSLFLKEAKLGDTVTLDCTVLKGQNLIEELFWYQQSLGYNPQVVAKRYYTTKTIHPPFTSRFTVGEGSNFNLTISNIKKEDEANYFCNQGGKFGNNTWKNGVFLTVTGNLFSFRYLLLSITIKFSLK